MMEAINWWGSLSISSKTYLECLCTVTISLMTFIPTLTKERRELVSTIFWGLDSYTCLHMTWQATGFLFSKYLLERSCRSRSWISFCTVFKKIHLNSKRSKHNEKHRSFNFFYLNYQWVNYLNREIICIYRSYKSTIWNLYWAVCLAHLLLQT